MGTGHLFAGFLSEFSFGYIFWYCVPGIIYFGIVSPELFIFHRLSSFEPNFSFSCNRLQAKRVSGQNIFELFTSIVTLSPHPRYS